MEALAHLEVTKLDNGGSLGLGEKVGIPGWGITIKDASGATVLTQQTDGKGKAYFRNLAPGRWIIQEEARVGWRPVTPDQIIIDLASPRDPGAFESLIFVNEQVKGYIAVLKKDIWGRPLADWTIRLIRKDGTHQNQEKVTDVNGQVYFTDLQPGEWIVEEVLQDFQDWWRPVDPNPQTVTLDQPGDSKQVTFTNEPLGCVDGYKINDLEQGLSDWQIEARNAKTGEVQAARTNAEGYFRLKLSLGAWTLTEVMQAGWTAVTPSQFDVEVTQLFACNHVRFKNRTKFACVDVYKKYDFDNVGLPGWLITLRPAYGGVAETGLTDGTGWVRFNELAPGDYILSETLQPGWVPVGPSSIPITLEASGNCSVVTFYNTQTNNYPSPSNPPARSPAPSGSGACRVNYTVRSGDTLYRIAVNHGVAWKDLQAANHLTNPRLITPGMVLCIP